MIDLKALGDELELIVGKVIRREIAKFAPLPTPEEMRLKRKLTTVKLGASVGVSSNTILRLEAGKTEPFRTSTRETLRKIAAELGESEEVYLEAIQQRIKWYKQRKAAQN